MFHLNTFSPTLLLIKRDLQSASCTSIVTACKQDKHSQALDQHTSVWLPDISLHNVLLRNTRPLEVICIPALQAILQMPAKATLEHYR